MGWSRAEGIVWARDGSEGGEHHAEGLRGQRQSHQPPAELRWDPLSWRDLEMRWSRPELGVSPGETYCSALCSEQKLGVRGELNRGRPNK